MSHLLCSLSLALTYSLRDHLAVLAKMHAPPKSDDPIATPEVLKEADGIIFGIPTRFGMAAAQVKSFMDSTGGLWAT